MARPERAVHLPLISWNLWSGNNNIVRLADAKIVAWSMQPAALLISVLSKRNVVAGKGKETWFTGSGESLQIDTLFVRDDS